LNLAVQLRLATGDIDAIVSVTGTRNWVGNLGLPIKEKWRPWMDAEKQVFEPRNCSNLK